MKGASDPSQVRMSGPLVGFSQDLMDELQTLGYATTTATDLMRLTAHLSRWLEGSGLGLAELTPSVIDAFVAARRTSHVNLSSARALDPIVGYLRRVGAVPDVVPAVPTTVAQVVLDGFVRFLLDERALSGPVAAAYAHWVPLRDLTRYRKRLIQAHTAECQRIQKTLEDAGIKLDSVASDVLGVSGRAMLHALIAGERDPKVLAELAKGKLRKKISALRQALHGRFRDHHALLVGLCLQHATYLEGAIAQLDERVDTLFATHTSEAGVPFERARDRLVTITGVGKRAAECILAEIGMDMTRFPTAAHLASWAGVAPGNNITGGKRGSGKTTKGDVWLIDMLTQCAWAAAHTRDTYLSAQFWRLARRIGKKKAAIAVGHSILVICWHLLSNDADYDDLGGDYFTRRDPDRQRDRLITQLHNLGYRVTLDKVAY